MSDKPPEFARDAEEHFMLSCADSRRRDPYQYERRHLTNLDKCRIPDQPVSHPNYAEVIREAYEAAAKATAEFHDKYGQTYPCGFAWVRIKPARGPFVAAIKAHSTRGWYVEKGMCIYNPSRHVTQSMDAKEMGAIAFAEVLRKHGVKCSVETRLD